MLSFENWAKPFMVLGTVAGLAVWARGTGGQGGSESIFLLIVLMILGLVVGGVLWLALDLALAIARSLVSDRSVVTMLLLPVLAVTGTSVAGEIGQTEPVHGAIAGCLVWLSVVVGHTAYQWLENRRVERAWREIQEGGTVTLDNMPAYVWCQRMIAALGYISGPIERSGTVWTWKASDPNGGRALVAGGKSLQDCIRDMQHKLRQEVPRFTAPGHAGTGTGRRAP